MEDKNSKIFHGPYELPLKLSNVTTFSPLIKDLTVNDLFHKSLKGELYETAEANFANHSGKSLSSVSQLTKVFDGLSKPLVAIRNFTDIAPFFQPDISDLKQFFDPQILWAFKAITATVSKNNATLGYHADNYYVAILQVTGKRRWRIWDRSVLTNEETGFILRENPKEQGTMPQLPSVGPMLDIELNPGEMIWIPALFPHMGTTVSDTVSVSISYAFTAWSHIKLGQTIRHLHPVPLASATMNKLLPTPNKIIALEPYTDAKAKLKVALVEVANALAIPMDEKAHREILSLIL